MDMLFKLGQVVMTSGIEALLNDEERQKVNGIELTQLLYRHQCGDDGDVCAEDKEANQLAIKQGDLRVFSVYKHETVTVWIITEHDRSYTTVLLPEEY